MDMNVEFLREWATALRSGKYAQTSNRLTLKAPDGTERHCCLGVACELLVEKGIIKRFEDEDDVVSYGNGSHTSASTLPDAAAHFIGISSSGVLMDDERAVHGSLTSLNDHSNYSFGRIAEVIENAINPDNKISFWGWEAK